MTADPAADRMLPAERSASLWLALVYGVRMLGMFLILPVFAVQAATMPGGTNPALVGLAMGMYGLSQALMQIPFGLASDRFGRKPVITVGLLMLLAGSLVAAWSTSLWGVTLGRALQGAGAVSAALGALVSDLTRDSQRSKAMAMIGGTIGVAFGVAMVAAPVLTAHLGLPGLFLVMAATAVLALAVIWWRVPNPPALTEPPVGERITWRTVCADRDLLRLQVGVFVLHLTQMALFVVVPGQLIAEGGLPLASHWKVYLPVMALSFVLMVPFMIRAERHGAVRAMFLLAVGVLAVAQLAGALMPAGLTAIVLHLVCFFVAFNALEALLPSLVSRLAPPRARGLALGIFNTLQSLGIFLGGVLGGLLVRHGGPEAVYLLTAVLLAGWFGLARSAVRWPGRPAPAPVAGASAGAIGQET